MEDTNNFQPWTDPVLLTFLGNKTPPSNYIDATMSSRSRNPSMSNSDSSPKIDSDDLWLSQSANESSTSIREFDGKTLCSETIFFVPFYSFIVDCISPHAIVSKQWVYMSPTTNFEWIHWLMFSTNPKATCYYTSYGTSPLSATSC